MAKIFAAQNLPADVSQVMDQLERHCLAPDGSLISKSTYYDFQLAREEMCKERQRYLESLAVHIEAMAMVEEYQQAVSVANLGGIRDVQGLYPQLGLKNLPQVYEALEHRMVVAEAAQRLRLPLISKDGEIHEEEIEKWSIVSRSSLDSTSTSVTMSSSTNSTNYTNISAIGAGAPANNPFSAGGTDASEPEVGGVPNRFLGITPTYLWQTQLQQTPLSMDVTEYQVLLAREIASRLDAKCDKLADAVVIDDIVCHLDLQLDASPSFVPVYHLVLRCFMLYLSAVWYLASVRIESSTGHQKMTSRLPERSLSYPAPGTLVKLIIEEIEREELAWREDLYSSDRKFAEYYNDELQKTWLCKRCETMSAKLRFVFPAADLVVDVTRLREYQGVDPHFDTIARQYHDIVKRMSNSLLPLKPTKSCTSMVSDSTEDSFDDTNLVDPDTAEAGMEAQPRQAP
ncbi:hypothetical protein DH2020_041667 [Rehmannia glutinosa]|uniref:Uncharacterized protein n=1 Tax=Rehmannia glutinosa TaxID=99300 RepID=A0ABR0UQW8_REHGL